MESIFEQVRERLDKFPQGFPKTASGVELEILKTLFSPEEAELILFLSPAVPKPASAIAGEAGREMKEIEDVLDRKKSITDVTRVAANTVSNYSRIKLTEIHDKALELMIARKDIKAIDMKD